MKRPISLTVKKIHQQRHRSGYIACQYYWWRRPRISASHRQKLRELLGQKPNLTLEEPRQAI